MPTTRFRIPDFAALRPRLAAQGDSARLDPATGLDADGLMAAARAHVAAHPGESRITTRAALLELALTQGRIGVDPRDCFAGQLEHGGVLRHFQDQWRGEGMAALSEGERRALDDAAAAGAFVCQLDLSHTCPDWQAVLSLGFVGLRDRAAKAAGAAADGDARTFYLAVARAYEAARRLAERLAELAETVGAPSAPALRATAGRAPATLHEALQLAYLYNEIQEIEGELVRSMGQFDRLYEPFYRRDLEEGRLTRDEAGELLKFFWFKFYAQSRGLAWGKNFGFGGLLSGGADATNDLTALAYETYRELRIVDPKFTMRVHRQMPPEMLRLAADCVRDGLTATVFMNDEVAFPMFLRRGKDPADIHDYVAIGCYEPAIMGKEMCCSMTILFNLAKPLELLLHGGVDPATGHRLLPRALCRAGEWKTFAAFLAAYREAFAELAGRAMDLQRRITAQWHRVNPSPTLSGTMEACMASGRDVSEYGAKYNPSGVMCAGLADAVDGLFAVRRWVYEEGRISLPALAKIMRADWQAAEHLRLEARNRLPKWGDNDEGPDRLARDLAAFVAHTFNTAPNGKGGTFQAGMWSIDHNRHFGGKTGALPGGRRAGEALAKNIGASFGRERRGVTAIIQSAAKLDHADFPDGSVLDVTLHPSAVAGADGAEVIAQLVRSYFALGGLAVQFNVMDAEMLKRARVEPERFADLQVRVCGWNARFIDLPPESQESFIVAAGGES